MFDVLRSFDIRLNLWFTGIIGLLFIKLVKTNFGKFIKNFVLVNLLSHKTIQINRFYYLLRSTFVVFLGFNLLGIIPYFPSITSHVFFTLIISVLIYISIILCSFSFSGKDFLSHFCPLGTPTPLIPFLILIELISNCIRPITLAVRVAANITTGHILLSLIGSFFSLHSLNSSLLLLTIRVFYTIFEFFVCLVQAYIFCILRGLFLDEHPWPRNVIDLKFI